MRKKRSSSMSTEEGLILATGKVQASHSSTTRMKTRHRAADTKAFFGRKDARQWIEREIDVAHEDLHISEV